MAAEQLGEAFVGLGAAARDAGRAFDSFREVPRDEAA
jgi:hypothetical protein